MAVKDKSKNGTEESRTASHGKKPYVKPQLERMNEKVPVASGQPPVPGAPASAQASPIVPGATVF